MLENTEIINFIKNTPKSELHLHIEGTLEPEHMFELAKRNNVLIPYKNAEEVKSAYNFHNLDSFLNIYYQSSKVLINEQDFFDLTWAYILKCKKDNVVHTEIFFDPQSHIGRGIDFDTVINGIYKALKKAKDELNISSKIIMCFLRHLDEESGFKVLEKALKHKDKLFGVGGYITESEGDMDTVFGYVVNYDAKVREDGGFDCSVEVVSKNAAILSHTVDTDFSESFNKGLDIEILGISYSCFK